MSTSTRLFMKIEQWQQCIAAQIKLNPPRLGQDFFCLVFGFFVGNIFGTFLGIIRAILPWDFLTILIITGLAEIITRKATVALCLYWRSLNLIKMGILFGFFVDAFKVGS